LGAQLDSHEEGGISRNATDPTLGEKVATLVACLGVIRAVPTLRMAVAIVSLCLSCYMRQVVIDLQRCLVPK